MLQFEFIELFLLWVILVTYNIGIYICIYIYKVNYIRSSIKVKERQLKNHPKGQKSSLLKLIKEEPLQL